MSEPIDIKKWLGERRVPLELAQEIAAGIRERYPHLTEALKAHKDILGELEVVVLVVDTMSRQFPPQ